MPVISFPYLSQNVFLDESVVVEVELDVDDRTISGEVVDIQ